MTVIRQLVPQSTPHCSKHYTDGQSATQLPAQAAHGGMRGQGGGLRT